jgi:hypothetical protein
MSDYGRWIDSVVDRVDNSPEEAAQFLAAVEHSWDLDVAEQAAQAVAAGVDPDAMHEGLDELADPTARAERIRARLNEMVLAANPMPTIQEGYALTDVERNAMYENEQAEGWRTNPTLKGQFTTEYEDRATLDDRAAGYEQGRILGPDGEPMNGRWGWVVDAETGLLLFFDPDALILVYPDGTEQTTTLDALGGTAGVIGLVKTGYRMRGYHHTSPVAGAPVAGAGQMKLEDGWVVEITDESGHYRPPAENQYGTMEYLSTEGVAFKRPAEWNDEDEVTGYHDAQVRLTGAGTGARPTDKAEWLEEAHNREPFYPTDDISLSSSQFEQTGGNEAQIRAKQALNKEFQWDKGPDRRIVAEGASDADSVEGDPDIRAKQGLDFQAESASEPAYVDPPPD